MAKTPSGHPSQVTKQDLEYAAEDARRIVGESSLLQTLVAALIVSRRLYMVTRSAMDNEIIRGWEIENPELVIQTLVMSAQDKANEKFKIADLQQGVLGTVVPFLDIIALQAQETGEDIDGTQDFTTEETPDNDGTNEEGQEAAPVLPRDDTSAEGELGALDGGAGSGDREDDPEEAGRTTQDGTP